MILQANHVQLAIAFAIYSVSTMDRIEYIGSRGI